MDNYFIPINVNILAYVNIASCDARSLILKEECKLRLFEKRILRQIFGPQEGCKGIFPIGVPIIIFKALLHLPFWLHDCQSQSSRFNHPDYIR